MCTCLRALECGLYQVLTQIRRWQLFLTEIIEFFCCHFTWYMVIFIPEHHLCTHNVVSIVRTGINPGINPSVLPTKCTHSQYHGSEQQLMVSLTSLLPGGSKWPESSAQHAFQLASMLWFAHMAKDRKKTEQMMSKGQLLIIVQLVH